MVENTIEELINTLRKENQASIDWFVSNEKIVIRDRFQAIIVKRNNKTKDSYPVHINQEVSESEKYVRSCLELKSTMNLLLKNIFPH